MLARVPADRGEPRVGARASSTRFRRDRGPSARARSTPRRSSAAAAWPSTRWRFRAGLAAADALQRRRARDRRRSAPRSARSCAPGRRAGSSHVLVDETRPLHQGARLTAWELERAGIPHAVITDSAAASLMARGEVDARRRRRRPDRRERRHRQQDRHVRARGPRARTTGSRCSSSRRPSTIDLATPTARTIPIEERDAATRSRPLRRAEPGVRRHAGRARHRIRHGARRFTKESRLKAMVMAADSARGCVR